MKRDKKESALRIMEALSGVDEELLERCEQQERKDSDNGKSLSSGNKIYRWGRRYGGLCAACLCLAVLGAAYYGMEQQKNSEADMAIFAQPECADEAEVTEEETDTDDAMNSGRLENREEPEEALAETGNTNDTVSQMYDLQGAAVQNAETESTKELPQTDKYVQAENAAGEEISREEACATEILGTHVPDYLPTGYQPFRAVREAGEDGTKKLLLTWTDGQHELSVKLTLAENQTVDDKVSVVNVGENWESEIPEPEEDGSTCFVLLYSDGVSAEYKGWLTVDEIKRLLDPDAQ